MTSVAMPALREPEDGRYFRYTAVRVAFSGYSILMVLPPAPARSIAYST